MSTSNLSMSGRVGEGRTLRHDRIGEVQDQRYGRASALDHGAQHPGRGDAALGDVQHQNLADIVLSCKFVARPRCPWSGRDRSGPRNCRWRRGPPRGRPLRDRDGRERCACSCWSSHDAAGDGARHARFHAVEDRLVAVAAEDVDELCRVGEQTLPAVRLRHLAGIALVEAHAGRNDAARILRCGG